MKIIEMLRLSEMGLSQRQIAANAGCGKSTVGEVLKRCRDIGVGYETAAQISDTDLHRLLYPETETKRKEPPEPNWKAVQEELSKHKNLNLRFLWEEYRAEHQDGLSYSRYCTHYRRYREAAGRSVSLHHERKAGEVMEVDWMGDTLPCVVNSETGELVAAHFFVAVMGYSGLPYVEAFPNEQEANWIAANVNALHYYGGVPRIIEPDNVKTAVKMPKYYEPVINGAYWELSRHYEVAIVPARVRKPKDKPLVEQTVGWLETWLLGKLRNQRFFSFHELNIAIRKEMEELSNRPFQKREGTRVSDFLKIDKPALRPLPMQKFEIADVVFRTVGDNYHLEYAGFYYSAPYTLHKEKVTLRATNTTIEIFDKNHIRMASHKRRRDLAAGRYVTNEAHMPPNHRVVHRARQFDGHRYRSWAEEIGENTYYIIDYLLTGGAVEEQGYKACMGILQLTKTYGGAALESACEKARTMGSCTYTTVKGIVKNTSVASECTASPESTAPTPNHENIRGGGYYM